MDTDLHLRYRKLVAEYYDGDEKPFCVIAHAADGHTYFLDDVEVRRCRCAKWTHEDYRYTENEVRYRRETWTGPGDGIAFVTNEDKRIK